MGMELAACQPFVPTAVLQPYDMVVFTLERGQRGQSDTGASTLHVLFLLVICARDRLTSTMY